MFPLSQPPFVAAGFGYRGNGSCRLSLPAFGFSRDFPPGPSKLVDALALSGLRREVAGEAAFEPRDEWGLVS